LIIQHIGQLLTLTSPSSPSPRGEGRVGAAMSELGIIEDGLVAIEDDKIVAVGKTSELKPKLKFLPHTKVIDAENQVVMPGFVDCHTHLVYGGSREDEFEMRASGVSYQEIAARGGGIRSTVKATRKASKEVLKRDALKRLDRMLMWGTTTAEAKSGYGLETKSEIKQLEVVKDLNDLQAIEVVPTFMGAHEFPEEFRSQPFDKAQGTSEINREGYVKLLCEEMIPKVAEAKLAEFCDVFCDQGVFTPDEAIKILETASNYGMYPKIHADELASVGAAEDWQDSCGERRTSFISFPDRTGTYETGRNHCGPFARHKPDHKKELRTGQKDDRDGHPGGAGHRPQSRLLHHREHAFHHRSGLPVSGHDPGRGHLRRYL